MKTIKINSILIISLLISVSITSCDSPNEINESNRWSEEKAWKWYSEQPWLVGTNFITSSSINQLEFWQEETFDIELIDKELELSASIGMNVHRVYLHYLLWEQDSTGFLNRIDKFLDVSEKYGIKIMFVFLMTFGTQYLKSVNNLNLFHMFIIQDGCNLLEQKFYMIR